MSISESKDSEYGPLPDAKTAAAAWDDHAFTDAPPNDVPLGNKAKRMISASFACQGMNNPAMATDFMKDVARTNWSELDMTAAQVRLWRSVCSHYRKWTLTTAE